MRGSRARTVRRQISATWSHPGNRRHRVAALLRLTRFHVNGRIRHRRTNVPIGTRSRLWADLAAVSTIKAVIGNPPDWEPMQAWAAWLVPGDLFLDVGASAGSYSIWAAELGASVIAVEPDPTARGLLTDNCRLNGYPIDVHDLALGASSGTTRFTTTLGTGNHLVADGQGGGEGVEVAMGTVDELIGDRRLAGMKIDVEGAERRVLEGASVALREGRIDMIQIEWNPCSLSFFGEDRTPIVSHLSGLGYRFFRPDANGRLVPADVSGFGEDVFAVSPQAVRDRLQSAASAHASSTGSVSP